MADYSVIATGPTPIDPNQLAYNQAGAGLGAALGQFIGKNMGERRLANQLNPMRQAALSQLQQNPIEAPTTEQQMAITALQDPRQFARLAGNQEGALSVGKLLGSPPAARDVVVHPDDELNKRLGLGLANDESAVIGLHYNRTHGPDGQVSETLAPGFTVKDYKTSRENDTASGSAGLAEIISINKARKAEGKPEMSADETMTYLQQKQMTSKNTQDYKVALNQWKSAGGKESDFPSFESWSPQFNAGQTIAEKGAGAAIESLSKARDTAQAARDQLITIKDATDLLNTGKVFTGTGATQRMEIARTLDTLLGRHTDVDAVSANTDAYLANAGRLVAKNMHAFGSGSGLTDKDLVYVDRMSGGDIQMTEPALRQLFSIVQKHARFELSNYNTQLGGLSSNPNYKVIGSLMQPFNVPEINTEAPAPAAAPTATPGTVNYVRGPNGQLIRAQ